MKRTSILIPCVFDKNVYTRAQTKDLDDISGYLNDCIGSFSGISDSVDIFIGTNSDVDLSHLNANIIKIDTSDTGSQFLPMLFFAKMQSGLKTDQVFACESDMVFHGNPDILLNEDKFRIRKVDPAYKGFLRRAYNPNDLKYPYSKDSYYQETIELGGEKYGVLKDRKNHGNLKCSKDIFDALEFSEHSQSFDPVKASFDLLGADFVDNAYMINLGGKKYNEEHYYKHRFVARNRYFPHTFGWRECGTFKYRCTDDVSDHTDAD